MFLETMGLKGIMTFSSDNEEVFICCTPEGNQKFDDF
jgi:hypothetical protein